MAKEFTLEQMGPELPAKVRAALKPLQDGGMMYLLVFAMPETSVVAGGTIAMSDDMTVDQVRHLVELAVRSLEASEGPGKGAVN